LYDNGKGVEPDYKEALKWYHLSAEQGNKSSQNNIGCMYYNGYGVGYGVKQD
jgi:TPR repeat protein